MDIMQMMVNMMIQQDPSLKSTWEQALKMADGKTPEQGQQMLNNIAKQRNIDLNQMQGQIQNFINSNPMFQSMAKGQMR